MSARDLLLFGCVAALFVATGFMQSWNVTLTILNMGLISAIMALGVNMQWGFAGLFNVGVMGFVALGGLGAVLFAMPPVPEAWGAGGLRILGALAIGLVTIVAAIKAWGPGGKARGLLVALVLGVGAYVFRMVFDPAVAAVEAVNPASTGYLGGLAWAGFGAEAGRVLVVFGWFAGGALAAGAAWVIGKTALGLRSDYLAIATLGIAEIIIAIMKHEDWMARGVKNVIGIPRPVPYEVGLQETAWFVEMATENGWDPIVASSIAVKLCYAALFAVILLALLWLCQAALASPWGRMMRAIRDNEVAAEAMGKDVKARHLQIFILGSAVCGLAGAMMTTLDGQLTPGTYQPLRFTFLIWVMVIVGGSGNNFGAVLGGFLVWWLWVQVEPLGAWVMGVITSGLADGSALKAHLLDSAAHMRLLTMGIVLLLVLRFSPRGLIPEK